MPLNIRPVRDDDRDALLEHAWLLNQHEEQITHNRRLDKAGAEDALAASEGRVERTGGVKLVAEIDGHVVGHLFLTFEEAPIYVRQELRPYAYIAEIFVQSEFQKQGIGSLLMAHAERIAVERGFQQILVGVQSGNVSAKKAYARFGFSPYAIDLVKYLGRSD